MSERFFSDIWYRVAQSRPALRPGVKFGRHRYGGRTWYVLEDRLTGKSHRFTLGAYLLIGRMDGRATVDTIWHTAVGELGEEAPTQDDAVNLLAQLHAADLLRLPGSPDVAELLERRRKTDRTVAMQNLLSPISFRLPLVNPDRFLERTLPLVRWMVGPLGLLLWLAVCVPAALLVAESWGELNANLSDRLLSAENMLILVLLYPIIKGLHELGHGYVAKACGAEVPEMGIMFLVFFPVPYVDASAAAAIPSKWRRAAVGAAGIMVELLLAALALYAWRAVEPGLVRAVLYNVMVIGGVSTLLVNGNPLLRFDGYFVMTDLIEMPNLAPRAARWWGHVVDRYAFRVPSMRDFQASLAERIAFAVYGPASFVYRISISVTIALFIASKYLFVGVAIALWSLVLTLGRPVGQVIWHVATGPRLRRVRGRALALSGGAVALVLGLLMLVPLPLSVATWGVVWLPETAQVRTRAGGFVERITVEAGQGVPAGDVLMTLAEPVFEAELATLEAAVREARLEFDQVRTADQARAAIARIALEDAVARRDGALERQARRSVAAPAAGRFVPMRPLIDLGGRYLPEGEVVGHILPEGTPPATIRAIIGQSDIDLVRARLTGVRVAPLAAPLAAEPATLLRAVPAGQFDLPSAALGAAGGGPVPVDPAQESGLAALSRVFQYELSAPPALAQAGFGARVLVRFDLRPEPVGWRLWRGARRMVLAQLDA